MNAENFEAPAVTLDTTVEPTVVENPDLPEPVEPTPEPTEEEKEETEDTE